MQDITPLVLLEKGPAISIEIRTMDSLPAGGLETTEAQRGQHVGEQVLCLAHHLLAVRAVLHTETEKYCTRSIHRTRVMA